MPEIVTFSVYSEASTAYLASNKSWFNGYEEPAVPAWGAIFQVGSIQLTAIGPSKLEKGATTGVMAWSANTALLGKLVTLTVDNPGVAGSELLSAVMEPDATGGVQALFEIKAVDIGQSVLQVEVG